MLVALSIPLLQLVGRQSRGGLGQGIVVIATGAWIRQPFVARYRWGWDLIPLGLRQFVRYPQFLLGLISCSGVIFFDVFRFSRDDDSIVVRVDGTARTSSISPVIRTIGIVFVVAATATATATGIAVAHCIRTIRRNRRRGRALLSILSAA